MVCSVGAGFDVALTGARGSGGVIDLGLGGVGGEAAQGGGGCLVSVVQIVVFLWHQYLQVVCVVVFVTGLAEEEQLLVVFPFGHIEFVRCPVGLDCLIFTVKDSSKVLELALYVFNCKTPAKGVTLCFSPLILPSSI